ncbi:MAG TPA: hypothetical protein PKV72_05245, partial [Candidatus Peribacteria bacterium]|nr:hypothetical protein [Candidatus Peribacteria bacterium]
MSKLLEFVTDQEAVVRRSPRRRVDADRVASFLTKAARLALADLRQPDVLVNDVRTAIGRVLTLYTAFERNLSEQRGASTEPVEDRFAEQLAVLRAPERFSNLRIATDLRRRNTADWFEVTYRTMHNDDSTRTDDVAANLDASTARFAAELNATLSPEMRAGRGMAPILAATLSMPIGRSLARESIRTVASRRSQTTFELLRGQYRPTAIIGTGPAGQAFG